MPDPAHKRLETDTDDGMLLIISGPSGVGKTTITRGVERSISGSVFSVSCTTRDKTPADVEGLDYHFITDAEFDRMKAAGEFLETAEIYGRKYGTPRDWVLGQLERGRLVILEIDVEGAKQVKSKLPHAYSIFILPPDDQTLLQRLRDRKREDEEKILRRFAAAQREIAEAQVCGVYDQFITNRVLDESIHTAIDLVRNARKSPRRQG
jgi:guanylate kinase